MKENLINVLAVVGGLAVFVLPILSAILAAYNHPAWLPVTVAAFGLFVWTFGRMR